MRRRRLVARFGISLVCAATLAQPASAAEPPVSIERLEEIDTLLSSSPDRAATWSGLSTAEREAYALAAIPVSVSERVTIRPCDDPPSCTQQAAEGAGVPTDPPAEAGGPTATDPRLDFRCESYIAIVEHKNVFGGVVWGYEQQGGWCYNLLFTCASTDPWGRATVARYGWTYGGGTILTNYHNNYCNGEGVNGPLPAPIVQTTSGTFDYEGCFLDVCFPRMSEIVTIKASLYPNSFYEIIRI